MLQFLLEKMQNLEWQMYFIAISTFLLLLAVSVNYASSVPESKLCERVELISRESFPEGFIFGAASSAYQYEGAFDENGKGPSMWDNYTHMYPGKIKDYSNGDIAVDSYHRYKEDVRIAKDMGLDAYRISISWPRILPGGTIKTGVNQNGVDYYNSLINELLDNGIEPFVTILHLDISQALQDAYGGFLSPQIVHDTEDFAELLFQEYGDRVKHWITINEPWTYSVYGYAYGYFAPGRCSNCMGGDSATEPYIVMHNQLLAHSRIVNLYRDKYQETQHGKIGIAIASFWFEPYDEKEENHGAKDRALDFMLGWIMEPLTVGKYPESMRSRVGFRLPEFTEREMNSMKGSFDFIGLNYYGAMYALSKPKNSSTLSYLTDSEVELTGVRNGEPIGEQARPGSRIFIYPRGLQTMLRHIKQKYNNPVIYITENGIDETPNNTLSIVEAVNDDLRKDYILNHLYCLREAIMKDGVDVKAYFVWSLMDNFEWASGFSVRFGLTYVDYSDKLLRRYPKRSGVWFKRFLRNGNPKIGPLVSDL